VTVASAGPYAANHLHLTPHR